MTGSAVAKLERVLGQFVHDLAEIFYRTWGRNRASVAIGGRPCGGPRRPACAPDRRRRARVARSVCCARRELFAGQCRTASEKHAKSKVSMRHVDRFARFTYHLAHLGDLGGLERGRVHPKISVGKNADSEQRARSSLRGLAPGLMAMRANPPGRSLGFGFLICRAFVTRVHRRVRGFDASRQSWSPSSGAVLSCRRCSSQTVARGGGMGWRVMRFAHLERMVWGKPIHALHVPRCENGLGRFTCAQLSMPTVPFSASITA